MKRLPFLPSPRRAQATPPLPSATRESERAAEPDQDARDGTATLLADVARIVTPRTARALASELHAVASSIEHAAWLLDSPAAARSFFGPHILPLSASEADAAGYVRALILRRVAHIPHCVEAFVTGAAIPTQAAQVRQAARAARRQPHASQPRSAHGMTRAAGKPPAGKTRKRGR